MNATDTTPASTIAARNTGFSAGRALALAETPARRPEPRPHTFEHCAMCDDLRAHTNGTCDGCGHTASIAGDAKRMTARELRAAVNAERTRRAKARGTYREPYDLDYRLSSI